MAKITAGIEGLKQTTAGEWTKRFLFGGVLTLAVTFIGKKWGPVVGGMFLAFPGIFPAGACLIEKHAEERKAKAGLHGEVRGRQVASLEAAGASAGAMGLMAFAAVLWFGVTRASLWVVMPCALASWAAVSWTMWLLREKM